MDSYIEQLYLTPIGLNYAAYHTGLDVHTKDDEIQEESLSMSCASLLIKKK